MNEWFLSEIDDKSNEDMTKTNALHKSDILYNIDVKFLDAGRSQISAIFYLIFTYSASFSPLQKFQNCLHFTEEPLIKCTLNRSEKYS